MILAKAFADWSPLAAASIEKTHEWSEAELISAAATVKRMLSRDNEDKAIRHLQGIASERKNILANDAKPLVRNAYVKKENEQTVTLLQGLEGRVDDEFLRRAGASMRVPYVSSRGHRGSTFAL